MKHSKPIRFVMLAMLLLFMQPLAFAHSGTDTSNGLIAGVLHPLSGLDHLFAMAAVGLWAAQLAQCTQRTKRTKRTQRTNRAIWIVPLAFVSIMAMGSGLGFAGMALPYGEQGIVISLLLLGTLIAASIKLPLATSTLIVGAFALCHGHAHGTEMPDGASGLAYGIGFVFTTILIHSGGIGIGLLLQHTSRPQLIRYTGAMIALFGGYSWLT